jgi:hypothetical protein
MKRNRLYFSLTSCVAFLIASQISGVPAHAQARHASLRGVARLGQTPAAEANIMVRSLQDNTARVVVTGADGSYQVDDLKPGRYEVSATKSGSGEAPATTIEVADQQSLSVDLALNAAKPSAAPEPPMTVEQEIQLLKRRIEQLEAERVVAKATAPPAPSAAAVPTAASAAPEPPAPAAPTTPPPAPAPPPAATSPQEPAQAKQEPAAKVDTETPFAFADFTWLNGTPRNKDVAFDTPFFTPEVRFDTHFMTDFNQPVDHTMGGATESFRSGEFQVEQISVGGDFHWNNVRGRILTMFGLFATTTPRNDASAGVGQWDVRNAYKYVSEAYGGYHFNVNHGLNVDAGIFVSYIGLFSYYNFDNWTYQPSFVSSNTPWFFNGLRIQWFPTNKLKIEPWIINGWQSYNRLNGHHGFGGQILYRPKEWLSLVFNNYGNGTDTLGNPNRTRYHSDDSIEVRYYNKPNNTGISKMAFSLTGDAGCESGGGVSCTGKGAPKQSFLGWMLYNRVWFHKDLLGLTLGGGKMNNPGRYLTLLPPINGADAISGSPYFTANPGDKAHMWDATINLQYMPKQYITWWLEAGYRHSDVPYWSGRGGITPPGGNNGAPGQFVCSTGAPSGTNNLADAQVACGGGPGSLWYPDLRRGQATVSAGVMVKF